MVYLVHLKYIKTIGNIFVELDGICIYIDDILVFGKTEAQHDERLLVALKRDQESGLKLSLDKSQFKKKSVRYLGYTLTDEGISINSEKIKMIADFKAPTNKSELQRCLGMIT